MEAQISWDEIRKAAAKWYVPPLPDLVRSAQLRPLSPLYVIDEEPLGIGSPTIAFPTALPPRPVGTTELASLRGLFFSPMLIRLNYVAQLSTTYMRANIDAKHCRLSHALGSLSIFSVLMNHLLPRLPTKECVPTNLEVLSSFVYVAIHDAFQGPFGHTLDAMREELTGGAFQGKRLDKALLAYTIYETYEFLEGRNEDPPAAVLAFATTLEVGLGRLLQLKIKPIVDRLFWATRPDTANVPPRESRRRKELGWIYDLLEGPLDADRWDYLWRDSLHLGLTNYHDQIGKLLNLFKDNIDVDWNDKEKTSRIIIPEKVGATLGKTFFDIRRRLYKNFYESPEKRLIDNLLVRCLFLALIEPTQTDTRRGLLGPTTREDLLNLINITDSELLSILERSPTGKTGFLIRHLAGELKTYPAVAVVWEQVMRSGEHHGLVHLGREKRAHFLQTAGNPPQWVQPITGQELSPGEQIEAILAGTAERLGAWEKHEGVARIGEGWVTTFALHCTILPYRLGRLLQFERLVWKMMKIRLEGTGIVDRVEKALVEAISLTAEQQLRGEDVGLYGTEMEGAIDLCPPVLVSFPWLAEISESALAEMAREERPRDVLVRPEDGGEPLRKKVGDLMRLAQDEESYIAVGGYPLFVARYLEPKDTERFGEAMSESINDLMNLGCCLALPRELIRAEFDRYILAWIDSAKK